MLKLSQKSLDILRDISLKIDDKTFHHHYHILYDIAHTYDFNYPLKYVEIGCYAGGSTCLLLQRPNTTVVSIDLGTPIPPEVVYKNVNNLNELKNTFYYIQGNSQSIQTVDLLKNLIKEIDILFIDGDHSYQGVINDFLLYEKMVKSGGYIIFDDYNDAKYSPAVKYAVDDILKTLDNNIYEKIGTIPNTLGARPASMLEGNDFILKKI